VVRTNEHVDYHFETCCSGPVEAELAYLGEAGASRQGVDLELLTLAQQMLRISVATICWYPADIGACGRPPNITLARWSRSTACPTQRRTQPTFYRGVLGPTEALRGFVLSERNE
jgi:hypothetical protein